MRKREQGFPHRGWAEMIRKVCEVDPLVCPKCQGRMRSIAFLTDYSLVDRIINYIPAPLS